MGGVGDITEDDNEVFMCIKKEGDSVMRIVSIHEEQAEFPILNLIFGLFIKDLDPFSTDFATCPPFLLISNSNKILASN